MAVFISALMILSVAGFIAGSISAPPEADIPKTNYNGYEFVSYGTGWQLQVGGQPYLFQYFPTDLENISVPGNGPEILSQQKVYLGSMPKETVNLQLWSLLLQNKGIIQQPACLTEEGCPDIPLMDCSKPGITLNLGPANRIAVAEQCFVLEAADAAELDKLSERLAYSLLGVMP